MPMTHAYKYNVSVGCSWVDSTLFPADIVGCIVDTQDIMAIYVVILEEQHVDLGYRRLCGFISCRCLILI